MVRKGSSVSNDAQDFDLAMTLRTLRSNFGLSRLFLFVFFFTKRRKAARISENKNKKQKNKNSEGKKEACTSLKTVFGKSTVRIPKSLFTLQ